MSSNEKKLLLLLTDPRLEQEKKQFREMLVKNVASELIEFWDEANLFGTLANEQRRLVKLQYLWDTYIKEGATIQQININHNDIAPIDDALRTKKCPQNLLDELKRRVLRNMADAHFLQFLTTTDFSSFAQQASSSPSPHSSSSSSNNNSPASSQRSISPEVFRLDFQILPSKSSVFQQTSNDSRLLRKSNTTESVISSASAASTTTTESQNSPKMIVRKTVSEQDDYFKKQQQQHQQRQTAYTPDPVRRVGSPGSSIIQFFKRENNKK
jgi:hypothetical protein